MSEIVHPDEPRLVRSASMGVVTPEAMRAAYEAVVEEWTALGMPPTALNTHAPDIKGIGSRAGSFSRKRKRLEESGFKGVQSVLLARLGDGCKPSGSLWESTKDWILFCRLQVRRNRGLATLGWVPTVARLEPAWFDRTFARIVDVLQAERGHERVVESPWSVVASDTSVALRDFEQDRSHRPADYSSRRTAETLVPDVWGAMFLGPAVLEAPMGRSGLSLREWIVSDPQRHGALRDFGSERLTEWRLPPSRLGAVREALFRGGRLYSRRFFQDSDGPYARTDLLEPWEWTGETPEQFRPEFLEELRRMREDARARNEESRERMKQSLTRERDAQDEARRRHVEEALEKLPAGPAKTPEERRERITRLYGMEHVAHRRHARDVGVVFDLREIERVTGQRHEALAMRAMSCCSIERFMGLTQAEIARELLRLDREGFPAQKPLRFGGRDEHRTILGVDSRGIARLGWRGLAPPAPRAAVCLTLEEFFDGNNDPRSIRVKGRRGASAPSLEECRETFLATRNAEAFEDVFLTVGAFPDPDNPDDDGMWFHADGAVVFANAGTLTETKAWLRPLGMYSFYNRTARPEMFERLPEPPESAQIHTARWWPRRDWRFPEDVADL